VLRGNAALFAEQEHGQGPVREYDLIRRDADALNRPAGRREDDVFHLHRVDHRDLRAARDCVALAHVDADDAALQRRAYRQQTFEVRERFGVPARWGRLLRCACADASDEFGHVLVDEARRDVSRGDAGLREQGQQEVAVRENALDAELADGAPSLRDRFLEP
jgi:hypothetical protein